jgi:hypothetical protein
MKYFVVKKNKDTNKIEGWAKFNKDWRMWEWDSEDLAKSFDTRHEAETVAKNLGSVNVMTDVVEIGNISDKRYQDAMRGI